MSSPTPELDAALREFRLTCIRRANLALAERRQAIRHANNISDLLDMPRPVVDESGLLSDVAPVADVVVLDSC